MKSFCSGIITGFLSAFTGFLIGILIISLVGCASSRVIVGGVEIDYNRFGDQHLKNVEVYHVNPDGSCFLVKFESQDSEATALNNAITVLGGLATK